MLVGEDSGEADQAEPNMRSDAPWPARVSGVSRGENGAEGDVERGDEIEGFVHGPKVIEDGREPAGHRRAIEGESEREQEKEESGDEDGKDDSVGECAEFGVGLAEKWGGDEEEVDGHVRDDHP